MQGVAPPGPPEISVVVATRDRPERLARLLRSLERVVADTPPFEVVLVDDASGPAALESLDAEARDPTLDMTVVRNASSLGPGGARNAGWRAARGRLVAFTDDDCEVDPRWLAEVWSAWDGNEGRIVQGRTEANPAELDRWNAFSRTMEIREPGPPWETCNLAFGRQMLEALDGFDRRLRHCGEDTDLTWRALRAGAEIVFVSEALVHHAVMPVGPLGMIRYAWHWHDAVKLFALHPDLRRRQLHHGLFWSSRHEHLLLALLALLLPRRLRPLAIVLAAPYLRRLVARRSGPLLAPYLIAIDATEIAAMVRGSLRERVLVL